MIFRSPGSSTVLLPRSMASLPFRVLEAHVARIGDVLLGGLHDVILVALPPGLPRRFRPATGTARCRRNPDLRPETLPLVVIGELARVLLLLVRLWNNSGHAVAFDREIKGYRQLEEQLYPKAVGAFRPWGRRSRRCLEAPGRRVFTVHRLADVVVGREVQPPVQ